MVQARASANDGLGLNDGEDGLPTRPQPREADPEGAIEGRKPWPQLLLGVDPELLPECELDDRLVLLAPEEGREAAEGGDEEGDHGIRRGRILAEVRVREKPESGASTGPTSGYLSAETSMKSRQTSIENTQGLERLEENEESDDHAG